MKVDVVKYSSEWEVWFKNIAKNLKSLLNEIPCDIEHAGSISVKGLDAKPIIDIDIILMNFNDFNLAKVALEKNGYFHMGDLGIEGREMFKKDTPIHPHNLYVCNLSSLALKNHLLFRDYLREDEKSAKKYAVLKRALARKYPNDVDLYCEAKSEFISNILANCNFDKNEIDSIKNANIAGKHNANR